MTHVRVLGTGGTISSRFGSGLQGATTSDGAARLVGEAGGGVEVRATDVLRTGSYLLTFADLRVLQRAVAAALADEDCAGVVITHGTDTMEESAFLLDLVHDSPKSVVLTGAQRTANSPAPDGPGNLGDAIVAAASPAMRDCGVLICFAGEVRSARGTRKARTWSLSAFDGGTVVATVRDRRLHSVAVPRRFPPLPAPGERFDRTRVEVVPCFLGAGPGVLAHVIDEGVDAVVLAGTGIGNAGLGFGEQVARATGAGIPVVLSSRVAWGPTVPVYGNGGGVDLVDAGAVASGELNAYQARILTALLVAAETPASDFGDRFRSYI